jgi:RNA polymerase sigma-70 factor (ECF subfamily)
MGDETDRLDVERVLAGDLEAFAGVVRRWQGPIVNLAWRYCRDQGRAEEIAQDVFLRVYRGLATWHGQGAFSTWLFAVAQNVCRRAAETAPPPTIPLDAVPEPGAPGDTVAALVSRERGRAVRRAVLLLPPRYRDTLVLYYFLNMNVTTVADVLSVRAGTVKARLHRGRTLLRRRLEREPAMQRLAEAT